MRYFELSEIIEILTDIKNQGFIKIKETQFRKDEGITGQILEDLFGLKENNYAVRDLGNYELKAFRKKSSNLTLFHKKPASGLTPYQLFDRFGYVKPSKRNPAIMKKKLFTTITGHKFNSLGLKLVSTAKNDFQVYYKDELLSTWKLDDSVHKVDEIIMVFPDTQGAVNTKEETFHFNEAYYLSGFKPLSELITNNAMFLDLCIDKEVNDTGVPHDRGPHIRLRKQKLFQSYNRCERII
jgi:hypothetical protein